MIPYIIGSVVAVSLLSIIGALPLLLTRQVPKTILRALLSLSVGTLLSGVFLHFLPEMLHEGYTISGALLILTGFFIFFLIEKLVHFHHKHGLREGHHHAYHLAPMNLAGEALHNFLDGLVIAGSYLVSVPLGIAATVSVLLHELPQELADFGILLYAGMSKRKALVYNFLAALTAILGALVGILLHNISTSFTAIIIPFTIGSFIYIGAANLIPELHKEHGVKQTFVQLLALLLGVLLMLLLATATPEHSHNVEEHEDVEHHTEEHDHIEGMTAATPIVQTQLVPIVPHLFRYLIL